MLGSTFWIEDKEESGAQDYYLLKRHLDNYLLPEA